MKDAQVAAMRITYEEAGAGPPLVLVHGVLHDRRAWRWQLHALADEFTVFAWDAPGCGQSSEPPASWRMPEYADCLASWLRAVGVESPHVVGLSWGGSLALELYRRHPDVPASLVLASAYAGWAGSLPPALVAERLEAALRDADRAPHEVIPPWIPGWLTSAAPPSLIHELMPMWSENVGLFHPTGYRAMFHAVAEADLRDVLPRIRVPTLLLYGGQDVRSPIHIARELEARIPGARLVVMPGVGHLSNVEAPDEFNAHVRQFIRAVHNATSGARGRR